MAHDGKICLVGGGARSGKSRFVILQALQTSGQRVFIATAQAFDEEMRDRIRAHQIERQQSFVTVETPIDIPEAINSVPEAAVVVVDCLTLWLSNLLLRGDSDSTIEQEVLRLRSVLSKRRCDVWLVTNEVGMGIVPESRLGRKFRDLAGRAHQSLAEEADEIYFAVLGTILKIRPSPNEVSVGG